jgi:lysophospholipase L1-like esterase
MSCGKILSKLALVSILLTLSGCSQHTPIGLGTIMFIGDSITSGHGLTEGSITYPTLVGQRWERQVTIIAQSGMQASEAPAWLEQELHSLQASGKLGEVGAIFIALGANDQLRGSSPQELEAALVRLGKMVQPYKAPIFLLTCQVPFHQDVRHSYQKAAQAMGAEVGPDIVAPYISNPTAKLWDNMHPSEQGHALIADIIDQHYRRSVQ